MLEVKDLNVFYGVIQALHEISFQVEEKEIVALIGANGAGKTTSLHTISSLVKPKTGSIRFMGKEISGLLPENIVKTGLIQVPEGRRIFAELSVRDNLLLGAYARKNRSKIHHDLDRIFNRIPQLKQRDKQLAGTLSGGEQQLLAIARALMASPQLLLLDEPSMGLAPIMVQEIFQIIREINQEGTTILLVEQNAHMALKIANRAYVLENGRVVLSGEAKELATSETVRKAYLGEI